MIDGLFKQKKKKSKNVTPKFTTVIDLILENILHNKCVQNILSQYKSFLYKTPFLLILHSKYNNKKTKKKNE